MNDMKELVTVEQAERVIALLAWLLPVLGIVIGAVVGAVRKRLAPSLIVGLLIGLIGPAVWALWHVYNGIMGRYGLDSVKALLINLALFIVIGLVIGFVLGRYFVRHRVATSQETPSTGS
jgi:hypothetical protein